MRKHTGIFFLAGGVGFALLLAHGLGNAEEKKSADRPKSASPASRLSQPALAIQLAMEGQKRKSPTLMLAAVELLAPLKESDRPMKIKGKVSGQENSKLKPLSVSVADWVDQARDFAKGDKEMTAFLDKRLEKLTSRGLIYSQGTNLTSLNIKGVVFKVLWSGVLNPGQEYTARNAIFEPNRPADIAAIADPGGDLDLLVTYNSTGGKIGQRRGQVTVVSFDPFVATSVNIGVVNAGAFVTRVTVIVNW